MQPVLRLEGDMAEAEKFTHAHDLTGAIDKLHDASMSRDELRACEGRMGKALITALDKWQDGEMERGQHMDTLLLAAKSGAISIFFTVLVNAAPRPLQMAIAAHMKEDFIAQYDRCVMELGRLAAQDGE
jgi:urease accessory protein UreF